MATRSFGGTYSRVGVRTARLDEARHLLIMLLRNIGQTQTCGLLCRRISSRLPLPSRKSHSARARARVN